MNRFFLLVIVLLPLSVFAQGPKNVLEIGHRSFYFPVEGLIFKNTNGLYFLIPPTVHYTRYLKGDHWGIQGGYNNYWQEHAYAPIYGSLRLRQADSFECSGVYRKRQSSKISFVFGVGLMYRYSGESRFIRRFSVEDIFGGDDIKDLGYRGGAAMHWHIFPRWFIKANAEFQGYLFRLNKPDPRFEDFKPVYNYAVFDIGFGFSFGKDK